MYSRHMCISFRIKLDWLTMIFQVTTVSEHIMVLDEKEVKDLASPHADETGRNTGIAHLKLGLRSRVLSTV